MPHSPELQGLRATAVLSVLIYHLDALLLPGGFLGVDIFFVLSGYLIGRKLLAELDKTGQINLVRFTAARIKRLLPNALAVLFFTGLASYLFLPPYRLADVGDDIWAAALVHSNIHFADRAIDYMQIGELPSPVLHFWSLSVEEQFYIFLPFLLLSTTLVRRNLRLPMALWLITITMIISFFSGLYDLQSSQPDAFFLTQNRIWQLCCGALSGVISARFRPQISSNASTVVQISALAVVAGSLIFISSDFAYPGVIALVPTLGASALIISIAFNQEGPLKKALSSSFCQWVGDRSYSIYLWHWPFIAIAAETYPDSRIIVWMAGLGSIIPAALTFKLLEQPIRKANLQGNLTLIGLGGIGAAAVATASVGLVSIPQSGKTVARAALIEAARLDNGGSSATNCHVDLAGVSSPPCTFGNNANGRIMLIGDSHAAQWFDPIRIAADEERWQFISRTKTSCPLLEVSIWYQSKAAIYNECEQWRASVLEEVAAAPPDIVILANSSGYDGWIAENGLPASRSRAQLLWETALMQLLERLSPQSEVWVIRDTPRMHPNYRACLSYSDDCHRPRTLALDGLTDDAQIANKFGNAVNVIDFADRFCDEKRCSAVIGGQIAYRDYHHITGTFSAGFTDDFRTILKHHQ
ncbi:acyltransferase family protein [Rhizobium leguminosarum]|uniref:acyltransferase family protein n=1 Tax=Rhizobium leguminosarum TaxID=384 RepID=UPI003F9A35A4